MSTQKIYIAGKVQGLPPELVADKFQRKANEIAATGQHPVNPVEIINSMGLKEHEDRDIIMRTCIKLLLDCDKIMLLNDWNTSKGATLERDVALRLGIPIVYPN